MGRQKQLIVSLEDSVVESLQAGDQVQLSGVISLLWWLMMPWGDVCMIVRVLKFACLGLAKGNAKKGIMAV